jgi:hypothetical protein
VDEAANEERVDEEIVMDPPPVCDDHVSALTPTPSPAPTPTVCRFASPPLVFQRARQAPLPRSQPGMARPRTLGEFFTAAKSRSNALL